MNKQLLFVLGGVVAIFSLFYFGKTFKPFAEMPAMAETSADKFNITEYLADKKGKLTASQSIFISETENKITRGDVKGQQEAAYNSLAAFYRDSLQSLEGYLHYTGEAAKLDKSEKNLTFAAQLFLGALRAEHDDAKLNWETGEAIALYEQALALNPENADLKIGLGSAYIFGRGKSGNPQETMAGVQQLLSVVRQDSTNMKAQLVLGIGGFASAQYDKAIPRLLKVVNVQPGNVEAVAFLADAYAASGNKEEAILWYERSKKLVNDAGYSKEVDERIKNLK